MAISKSCSEVIVLFLSNSIIIGFCIIFRIGESFKKSYNFHTWPFLFLLAFLSKVSLYFNHFLKYLDLLLKLKLFSFILFYKQFNFCVIIHNILLLLYIHYKLVISFFKQKKYLLFMKIFLLLFFSYQKYLKKESLHLPHSYQ